VGIIDYLVVWDMTRRVEFELKNRGLLGRRGKEPTIVRKSRYAQRFVEAMFSFFVAPPHRFTRLYRTAVRTRLAHATLEAELAHATAVVTGAAATNDDDADAQPGGGSGAVGDV